MESPVKLRVPSRRVRYAASPMVPHRISILGGGITGLSSAFHLSRRFPNSLITLLEKESRLGGWVRSERIEVHDKQGNVSSVLLEAGPRTLRPNAKSILELVNLLELSKVTITTPKTSPAAKNRFLHIPESSGLVALPSSIPSVFTSTLRSTLLSSVLREVCRRPNRPLGITDESFETFMTRRFGESLARILGSAVAHGIYAADARKLSVRAAFPLLWEAEERGWGSVTRGLLRPSRTKSTNSDYELGETNLLMDDVSVYSFRDGLSSIPNALSLYLQRKSNLRLVLDTKITSLRRDDASGNYEMTSSSGRSFESTHVVSTLPLPVLHSVLSPPAKLPHLTANPSSSVSVINLVFPLTSEHSIHPPGFGYLVPRPASGYGVQNDGVLGTVFDSCALSLQDINTDGRVTKMTMMIGGPHPLTSSHTSISTVLKYLASQLSLSSIPDPLFYRVHHHKDCIPTPTVGHLDRMEELKTVLREQPWNGRLEVIGAGIGGVSVGDCIEAGKRVGRNWV